MIPQDSRFETDPEELVPDPPGLPQGWSVATPDPSDRFDVARLTQLHAKVAVVDDHVVGCHRAESSSSGSPLSEGSASREHVETAAEG